jgi:hypothetical protein
VPTEATHAAVQLPLQQAGMVAQTCATHGLQPASSAAPTTQASCAQLLAPQSP